MKQFFFFSLYLRPSMSNSTATTHFYSTVSILGEKSKYAIICMDSHSRNTIWGSSITNKDGEKIKNLILILNLNLANRPKSKLSFIPNGTSFIDITLHGHNTWISLWHYLDMPSLFDHPYISFCIPFLLTPKTERIVLRVPPLAAIDQISFLLKLKARVTTINITDTHSADGINLTAQHLAKTILESARSSKKRELSPSTASNRNMMVGSRVSTSAAYHVPCL